MTKKHRRSGDLFRAMTQKHQLLTASVTLAAGCHLSITEPDLSCDSSVADTCTGNRICMADRCEPAYGRDYRVTAITVHAAQPTVVFLASDMGLSESPELVTPATWTDVNGWWIQRGDYMHWDVWSDWPDGATRQHLLRCNRGPMTAAQLRSRRMECAEGGISLMATWEPEDRR